MFTKNDRVSTP